jgi:hypothetical protein
MRKGECGMWNGGEEMCVETTVVKRSVVAPRLLAWGAIMFRGKLVPGSALARRQWHTALCICLFVMPSAASADPTPASPGAAPLEAIPGPVAEELRRIQRDLGGSAVETFPSLREDRGRPLRLRGVVSGPAAPSPQAVDALREAAAQLDTTANRLERLELYRQADALREQAHRLRLDARGMMGAAAAPTPVLPWGETVRPSGGSPVGPRVLEPQSLEPQPLEPRAIEPIPLQPENPQNPLPQPLEPAPSPE